MKTHELLSEAAETAFDEIKTLNVEFKKLAAQFELTLIAGMGWPNVTQQGGWFGGGLGNKGGKNRPENDIELPVEIRRKAFLRQLAVKLESLLAAGHPIKIGRGATRSSHTEDGIKGKIYDQLLDNMVVDSPPGNISRENMPCLVWFVGLSGELANNTALRLTLYLYGPPPPGSRYGGQRVSFDFGGNIDIKQGRKLQTAFTKFKNRFGAWTDYKSAPIITHSVKPEYLAFIDDISHWASRTLHVALPADFKLDDRQIFGMDRKMLRKNTVRLSPKQLQEVIDLMWKHFK